MRTTLRFKIVIIFCLFIGLTVPIVLNYLENNLLDEMAKVNYQIAINNTTDEICNKILYDLLETESSERGYVSTGEKGLMNEFNLAEKRINSSIENLKLKLTLTKFESQIPRIIQLINKKLKTEEEALGEYINRESRELDAIKYFEIEVETNEEIKLNFNSIHEIIVKRNAELNEYLLELEDKDRKYNIFGNSLAIAAFIMAFIIIFRHVRIRDNYQEQLIESQAKILENETKFKNTFYFNPSCVVYFDFDEGLIKDLNESFLKLTGYLRDELIENKNVFKLLKIKDKDIKELMDKMRSDKICNNLETQLIKKNGDVKDILISAILFKGANDKNIMLQTVLDVTETKRTNQELYSARLEAEKAANIKEQFLANMSHEFRTPLNAITGFTNLLGKTNLNEKQSSYVDALKTSSENLLHIANDLLDYSKLEAGMFRFEKIEFGLKQLLQSAYAMFNEKAEQKKLEYNLCLSPELPNNLIGDPTRLTQVMVNLLGNAFKFTEKGFINLAVSIVKQDKESLRLLFTVEDSGIGIKSENLDKIFERFTQSEESTTRIYGGTGLGLAIVKEMVEQQQGTISVESTLNIGTKFHVTLPFSIGKNEDCLDEQQNQNSDYSWSKRKILLVEDNLINQLLSKEILEAYKLSIQIADNGAKAIEILQKETFDLILMDLQMPEMDGYQATKIIRDQLKINVPIIAMSARSKALEEEKCRKAGMNNYLTKPFKEETLLNILNQYLGSGFSSNATKNTDQNEVLNMELLIDLSNGNKEFIQNIFDVFLQETPIEIEKIKLAIHNKDFAEIKALAHKLISSAGILGMNNKAIDTLTFLEENAEKKMNLENCKTWIEEFEGYFIASKAIIENYKL